jgi:hypothetical protein
LGFIDLGKGVRRVRSVVDLTRRWARLIKKIYEISPLVCKKCGGEMKVISVITDYEIRKKILKHLGLWNQRIHTPPPLPNFHPPPATDFFPEEESYSQDFIPPDGAYIVDEPFFLIF